MRCDAFRRPVFDRCKKTRKKANRASSNVGGRGGADRRKRRYVMVNGTPSGCGVVGYSHAAQAWNEIFP